MANGENPYFKPNPALASAKVEQEQLIGRQQHVMDMQAADAIRQTEELKMADDYANQREAEANAISGLQQGLAVAGPTVKSNQGLGLV